MAQGRESLDFARDRELVERLVERFKGSREIIKNKNITLDPLNPGILEPLCILPIAKS
jgi:hypothetical protein